MTAINVFRMPDRIVMLTDSAFYTRDFTVYDFADKAVPIPGMDAVVAARGLAHLAFDFAGRAAQRYTDFDDMASRVECDLMEWEGANAEAIEADGFHEFEIVVAGWSQKERSGKIFRFQTRSGEGSKASFEALSMFNLPFLYEEEQAELAMVGSRPAKDFSQTSFDPLYHGVQIMECQRRQAYDTPWGAKGHIVGGHILMTEIRPGSVTQRVIHQWSDKVGERIIPEPLKRPARAPLARTGVVSLGVAATPLNRQQRRRAARATRAA